MRTGARLGWVNWVTVGFFLVNLYFIPYIVDLEQLVIADPTNFRYPLWLPAPLVDLVHWYGRNFDPVLMAGPMWWKMTIRIDVLFFGPFYTVALNLPWLLFPLYMIYRMSLRERPFGSAPA